MHCAAVSQKVTYLFNELTMKHLVEETARDLLFTPLPDPCRCEEPVSGEEDRARNLIQCRTCGNWLTLEHLRASGIL